MLRPLRLLSLALAGLLSTASILASARSEWKQVLRTIGSYAAEGAKSPPDATALGNQANLLKFQLEAFVAGHPDDREAWTARILLPEVAFNAATAIGNSADWRETAAAQAALCADPALPDRKRPDAELARVSFLLAQQERPDFTAADRQAATELARAFVQAYPWHKAVASVALPLGELLAATDQDGAREAFTVAKHSPDPQTASRAESGLAVLPYRWQPLDWKFTTFDGRPFDLAAWRGKVVVVDFWATWCPPCMQEVPELVALHRRYHERGVEVVGISLDDNAAALKAGLARKGITWPQYFDGGGWDNRISRKFGIASIPTMWVLDREGRVVTTKARAGSLEGYLRPLLAGGETKAQAKAPSISSQK